MFSRFIFILRFIVLVIFLACDRGERSAGPDPDSTEQAKIDKWIEEMRQFAYENYRVDELTLKEENAKEKWAFVVRGYNVMASNYQYGSNTALNECSVKINPQSKTGVEEVFLHFRDSVQRPSFKDGRMDLYYRVADISIVMEMLQDTTRPRLGWMGKLGELWHGEVILHGYEGNSINQE